jgi:hypothetical protein
MSDSASMLVPSRRDVFMAQLMADPSQEIEDERDDRWCTLECFQRVLSTTRVNDSALVAEAARPPLGLDLAIEAMDQARIERRGLASQWFAREEQVLPDATRAG